LGFVLSTRFTLNVRRHQHASNWAENHAHIPPAIVSLAFPIGADSRHRCRRAANDCVPVIRRRPFSPADDILELAVEAVLVRLLGWHWEFLPAFAGELVPGVDLVSPSGMVETPRLQAKQDFV